VLVQSGQHQSRHSRVITNTSHVSDCVTDGRNDGQNKYGIANPSRLVYTSVTYHIRGGCVCGHAVLDVDGPRVEINVEIKCGGVVSDCLVPNISLERNKSVE
jgi:hypothetical protein